MTPSAHTKYTNNTVGILLNAQDIYHIHYTARGKIPFYILLTAHLGMILANNQLDTLLLMYLFIFMFVHVSRGLCDGLITSPEESYRLWCVVVCDLETSSMRRPWPTGSSCPQNKRTNMFRTVQCSSSGDRLY